MPLFWGDRAVPKPKEKLEFLEFEFARGAVAAFEVRDSLRLHPALLREMFLRNPLRQTFFSKFDIKWFFKHVQIIRRRYFHSFTNNFPKDCKELNKLLTGQS